MKIVPPTPPFIRFSGNSQLFPLSLSIQDTKEILLATNYACRREKETSTFALQTIQLEKFEQCHVENDQWTTANIRSTKKRTRGEGVLQGTYVCSCNFQKVSTYKAS